MILIFTWCYATLLSKNTGLFVKYAVVRTETDWIPTFYRTFRMVSLSKHVYCPWHQTAALEAWPPNVQASIPGNYIYKRINTKCLWNTAGGIVCTSLDITPRIKQRCTENIHSLTLPFFISRDQHPPLPSHNIRDKTWNSSLNHNKQPKYKIRRSRWRIFWMQLARRPAILIQIFRGFRHFLQTNAGTVP
jgi:hypothetical protein